MASAPISALRERFGAHIRRPPLAYAQARALVERMETDPEAREAERRRLRATTLGRIAGTAWGAAHDPAGLPLLTKAEVRADPQAFRGRTFGPVVHSHTSGTSGASLAVARSLGCVVFEQAAIDWVVWQAGLDFRRARTAVFRAADLRSLAGGPFWTASSDGRRLEFSSNDLGHATFAAFAGALEAFRPDILFGYPSAIAALARLYLDSGRRLAAPLVLTSSETFLPGERALAAAAFSARTIDYYGQAERTAFAYSLEPGVYRFMAAYGDVELLSEAEAGDTGEAGFEVVGTAFHNAAQLLPRYRTGDSILLPPGADPARIASGEATFSGIVGRTNDVIRGPNGEAYIGLNHIPRGLDRFERLQLVQTAPDHVRILVIGTAALSPEDVAAVMRRARLKLPESIRIDVVAAAAPLRTAAGKAPLVISHLDGTTIR